MKKTKPKPKMMDADTFLRKLGKLKGNGWRVTYDENGPIRCQDGWCPIIALYRRASWRRLVENLTNDDVDQAARLLRIPTRLADRIVNAADDGSPKYLSFRRRLLATLGLA